VKIEMILEALRSKLNIHRLWLKNQKIKEKEIECYVKMPDGILEDIQSVELRKTGTTYSIVFIPNTEEEN
jgi:hypothetical protein